MLIEGALGDIVILLGAGRGEMECGVYIQKRQT